MARQIIPMPAENDRHFMIRTYGDQEINPRPESRSPSPEIPPNFVPEAPKDSSHFPACSNLHNLIERLSGVSANESLIIPARTWDRNNEHWEHKFAVLRRKHRKEISEKELQISKKYDEKYSDAKYRQLVLENGAREMEFARTDDSVGVLGRTYKDHLEARRVLEEKYVKKIEALEKGLSESQKLVNAQEKVLAEKDASINALKDAIAMGNEQRVHYQQPKQFSHRNQESWQAYIQQNPGQQNLDEQAQPQQSNHQQIDLQQQDREHPAPPVPDPKTTKPFTLHPNQLNRPEEPPIIPSGSRPNDAYQHSAALPMRVLANAAAVPADPPLAYQNISPAGCTAPPQGRRAVQVGQIYPVVDTFALAKQQYNQPHAVPSGPRVNQFPPTEIDPRRLVRPDERADENQQQLLRQQLPAESSVPNPLPAYMNGGVSQVNNAEAPQINKVPIPNNMTPKATGQLRDTSGERANKRQRFEVREPGRVANINTHRGAPAIPQQVAMNIADFPRPEKRTLVLAGERGTKPASQYLIKRIFGGKLQWLEVRQNEVQQNEVRVTFVDPASALKFYEAYNSPVKTFAKSRYRIVVQWDHESPEVDNEIAEQIASGATRCLMVSGFQNSRDEAWMKYDLSFSPGDILGFSFSENNLQEKVVEIEYRSIELAISVYERIQQGLDGYEGSNARYLPDPVEYMQQPTGDTFAVVE